MLIETLTFVCNQSFLLGWLWYGIQLIFFVMLLLIPFRQWQYKREIEQAQEDSYRYIQKDIVELKAKLDRIKEYSHGSDGKS